MLSNLSAIIRPSSASTQLLPTKPAAAFAISRPAAPGQFIIIYILVSAFTVLTWGAL